AGCALVVTSRRRFALPGLTAWDLDALPTVEAVALLRGLAPRLSEAEAGEVARHCGELPLALRLAGSLLAERDDLSVGRYLERLRAARLAARTGLSEVAASIRLSEEALPEDLRSAWRILSVLVGGFEVGWAAAVWDVDADEAEDRLAALRRISLLEWDTQAQLYCLHDLVREYAASLLDPMQRLEAERRHGRFFLAE